MKNLYKKNISYFLILVAGLLLLHGIAQKNYLLFHTLVELFSIIVAFAMFTLTWSARKIIDNTYLIIVGFASIFIGFLDLLHTITYTGMDIIPGNIYFANQFWVATRFFESLVLLLGFAFVSRNIRISFKIITGIYLIITTLIIFSILVWKIFPLCYIEGSGQTRFKIISEYVIITILIGALIFLIRKKKYFLKEIYLYILLSILFTILSEFTFTLYFSNTGYFNEIGHFFKILSFYFIYKAIVETGFVKPGEMLYRNLKLSREEAEKYNKQLEGEIATRDKLFSIIAHDLRSPFSILLIVSEMLYKKPDQFNANQLKLQYEMLYKTSINTLSLLDNLLEWTRVRSGTIKPVFDTFDLIEVIKDKIYLFKGTSDYKKINLEYISSNICNVTADRQMVDIILRNLISNALKFTREGGRVTVSTSQSNNEVIITVADTGVGIPPEDIEKIFSGDLNWTTQGTDNEKGSGLGLQLCREFVEKNNGKLWVESEPEKGSRFMFSLKCDIRI